MMENQDINTDDGGNPLFDLLPCGLLSLSPDGTITAVNSRMAEWTCREVSEILGSNFRNLLDRPSLLYYNLVVEPLVALQDYVNEISIKFNCVDGNFDALLNLQGHKNAKGSIGKITAAVFKVLDRKRYEVELLLETRRADQQRQLAEEEKRKSDFLFNSLPHQVWTTSPDGQVLTMNDHAQKYLGGLQTTPEKLILAVDRKDRLATLTQWRNCLSTGKTFERDIRLKSINGIAEWFLVRAEAYYDPTKTIEMWFCSAINIHRKKLLQLANQQEMRENLSIAYQSLDEKSSLLVDIATAQSHMVRRPLANILGLTTIMKGENDPNSSAILLEKLIESAAELDTVIKEISRRAIS